MSVSVEMKVQVMPVKQAHTQNSMRTSVITLKAVPNGQAQDVVATGLFLFIQLMVETTVIPVVVVMVIMLPVLVVSHPDMIWVA